jgi:TPR repeat protein
MSAIASLHVEHMPGYNSADGQQAGQQASQNLQGVFDQPRRVPSPNKTGLSFPNKSTAIAALHALSDANFARAQFELGLAYSVGNGVPQNHTMAVAQLEKAAIQQEPGAIFILARYFETGLGGIPVNPARAESCKLAVAQSGIDFTSLVLHAR